MPGPPLSPNGTSGLSAVTQQGLRQERSFCSLGHWGPLRVKPLPGAHALTGDKNQEVFFLLGPGYLGYSQGQTNQPN